MHEKIAIRKPLQIKRKAQLDPAVKFEIRKEELQKFAEIWASSELRRSIESSVES